jgi:quinol monooxygenase YgiN
LLKDWTETTEIDNETWESHEDVLNVLLHRPYRQAWHEALPRILEGERNITIWEPLRSDRKRM